MLRDTRFAVRQLSKSPGFVAVALLTLALGVGANTAIVSVIRAVLLADLPYPAADRLVVGWQTTLERGTFPFSYPNYVDYAAAARSFQGLALGQRAGASLVGLGLPERVQVGSVTANYFNVAGVAPLLGRPFLADDDKAGAAPVVAVSEGFWRRELGARPEAIGRTLELNGTPHTIVAVMPQSLDLPQPVDLWRPMGLLATQEGFLERANHPSLFALGRLRDGVTLEQAQREATSLWARIKAANPQAITTGITLQALLDNRVGSYRTGLFLLLGAALLVLAVAAANFANLLLARGGERAPEIAVRLALGAGRARIARQLLAESLVLAAGGGALGVALAFAARPLIVWLSPADVARFQHIPIDRTLLLVGLGLALAAGLLFGLWPAWSAARIDPREALPGAVRGGSGGRARVRARETLIVAEVALTLVLLIGAGLLVKSFARVAGADLGIRPQRLLLAQIAFPGKSYPNPRQRTQFVDELLVRLRALPGVTDAAVNTAPPLSPGWQTLYFVEGRQVPAGQAAPLTDVATVSDNYFALAGIALLTGRPFAASDTAEGPKVVIVDQRMARDTWPGENVVGRRLTFAGGIGEATIVGIAPTLPIYGYATAPTIPQVYFLQRQVPYMSTVTLLLRAAGDPWSLRAPLAAAVAALDRNLPVWNVRTLDEDIARTHTAPRLYTFLLACFGLLALALAAVGLYGVIAYSTGRRTREIGIRLALGARARQVFADVLGRGLKLLAVGAALGLGAALVLSRETASLLYAVSPLDPAVYAAGVLFLTAVAIAACWLPARRAAALDPAIALRSE